MKINHILLISLLIVGTLLVPAVSAEIIEGQIHEVATQIEEVPAIDGGTTVFIFPKDWRLDYNPFMALKPASIHLLDVRFNAYGPSEYDDFPYYQNYYCELEHGDTKVADVQVEYFKEDFEANKVYGSVIIRFSNWNHEYLNTLTENATFSFHGLPSETQTFQLMAGNALLPSPRPPVIFYSGYNNYQPKSRVGHHAYYYEEDYFINNYTISIDDDGTDIYIIRNFDDVVYASKIVVSKSDGTILYKVPDFETTNRHYVFPYRDLIVDIESVDGKTYRILGDSTIPTDPVDSGITVYIKNSQTGALIANANVVIDALVDGEYYTVTNRTEPSGIFTINLQPTGGGKPNPDGYRLIVTADGYNNPLTEIHFTLGDYMKYFECFLDPIGTTIPTDPDDSGITVYIKNSQTGALIANANIVIDALVDGEYYPVTNRTEPSGIFTITLQPTGGGKPNPDCYRLIVTADGYNNPMPEIHFTLGDYRKYFECFLDPIAGGPADENKTFIDFFVRDMSSNPISGATVKFGKYTLITNSAGYTVFEVDKNNNYSWTVSKSGYGPLTGNAVIGNDPRHTINTVLAPIVTPTTPTATTPIPTSPPIGPTPTMTAPTGEHVSNWLEWFAAHFGMILGGGVEIGKIFMWLCFTVPVGVYVGKESKAGAAGFMAGAGIVTLFFVLIGWVPIWLVVLLALIIGLLYAKVFSNTDNGGGR